MKYTLYLRVNGIDSFLQKGHTIEDLQKSHTTIVRWIGQMNLVVSNANSALLVIAETDKWLRKDRAILEAKYVSGTRRVWRHIPPDLPGSVIRTMTLTPVASAVKTSDSLASGPPIGDSPGDLGRSDLSFQ
jgi:hypothetical protein